MYMYAYQGVATPIRIILAYSMHRCVATCWHDMTSKHQRHMSATATDLVFKSDSQQILGRVHAATAQRTLRPLGRWC